MSVAIYDFAIDCGHTLSGADYGAVGIKAESILTREVGKRVITKLRNLNYRVLDVTVDKANSVSDSLYQRVAKAKAKDIKVNKFISIHFNQTTGGYGTEIYTYQNAQLQDALNILKYMNQLGYRNRGIKDGSGLYVINATPMVSMLIECAFVDSVEDMKRYNPDLISDAIVRGLTGKVASNNSNNNLQSLDGKLGIVTAKDGLNVRSDKSTNSRILGVLKYGEKVRLFKKENNWISIYYKPHGGYVYADYIEIL